jgi:hypothetical protein
MWQNKIIVFFIILLVGVCFGQDGIRSIFKSKYPKINCEECGLSMKQTINAFVCVDHHMRIKKSDLLKDLNGNYYLPSKEIRESNRIANKNTASEKSWYKIATGTALLNAGINYYLIINDEGDGDFNDYIKRNEIRNDHVAYSLMVAGICVLFEK